ncbi:MAG: hypothetical protein KOO60_07245 [Gemmatimonadales bacterium]|nr:hypothetical protein [Gemmatimonadales bacterium]
MQIKLRAEANLLHVKEDSELAQRMREHFQSVLGLDGAAIDVMIAMSLERAFETATATINKAVEAIAREKAGEFITKKCEEHFGQEFEIALDSSVLMKESQRYGGDHYIERTVREMVAGRMKEFFDSTKTKKDAIAKTLDEAIGNRADRAVKEAIKELKEDCIEKFNKEAMKKMMQGMARELQSDKRLLALLGGP